MSRFLRETLLVSLHFIILVGITAHVFAGEDLIPDTCGRIASIGVIEMIAVPTERVPERRSTTKLDGLPARYEEPLAM